MEYRTLGRTGVRVSTYALGTMMFGSDGNSDEKECIEIVHAALDAGINLIDTADTYSHGEAEAIVGKAIAGHRDEIVLSTKVRLRAGDGPNEQGASRLWIMAPIYAPTITSASPCSVLSEGANARVEPEIAFVLGRDLKRRAQPYSDADVRSAIRETRLVLELIGCRYADPTTVSFLEMLADGLNNQGLFVGPEVGDGAIRPLETIWVTVASGTEY